MAIQKCLLLHPPARTMSVTPIQGFGEILFFVDYPEFRCASLRALLPRASGAFRGAIQVLASYLRPVTTALERGNAFCTALRARTAQCLRAPLQATEEAI